MHYNTLGEYVASGRTMKKLGKSEVARRASITPQFMRDIENNRTIPSEEKLELLVNILELDEPTAFRLADKLPVRIINKAKTEFYGADSYG